MIVRIFFLSAVCLVLCLQACGERMLPPAPESNGRLVLVDWDARGIRNRTEDLSVRTLQGLVNRTNPRVWVGVGTEPGSPGWWVARYREMEVVSRFSPKLTREQFLQRYRRHAKGVVVPPENLGQIGYRVAVMRAAADDCIVGTSELARTLGLPVVEDYSNRFASYADSWRYAVDELWPKLSHNAIIVDRDDLTAGLTDYAVQHRLFVCGPHPDDPREMKLFEETLARLPHNSPVIGSAGGGGLHNEGDIVRAVSKSGKVFVGCSNVPNLSVHGSLGEGYEFRQPMREPPKLDRNKVYVAVEISDGDNSNVQITHGPRRRFWENRGRLPLGWTMGQGVHELAPAVARYYYETRTELDEFICGVSGYAYTFPGDFANSLSNKAKDEAWRVFLDRTDEFLAQADMKVLTTIHYQEAPGPAGREVFERYARGLKNAAGIINGYNGVYQEYDGKTYEIIEDLPVFHTLTDRTWSEPGDPTLADDVIARTPEERPAFVALFMLPFALRPENFEQVADSLRRLETMGYEVVLPSELASLVKQAQADGAAK